MAKFSFYFQKAVLVSVMIGAMVSVIPFVLLLVEAYINKEDSLFAITAEYIMLPY